MASFVLNSTHAIMCGGFVSGPSAYTSPSEYINECYIFSESEQRFVTRVVDSSVARNSAPMWVMPDSTVIMWSGASRQDDYANYTKFNVSNFAVQVTNFSAAVDYGAGNPGSRSHLPYFRTDRGTYIFSSFASQTAAYRDVWFWSDDNFQWSWVGGDQFLSPANADASSRVSGAMFEFNPTNLPRARNEATFTKVSSRALPDMFYVFGGNYFPSGTTTWIADVWAFNASLKQWANYSRIEMQENGEVTGTVGTFGAGNYPRPRTSGSTWVDDKGYIWLFGGHRGSGVTISGLWVFNPYIKMWANVNALGDPIRAGCSVPAARARAASWSLAGSHYLYGGGDTASTYFQDLWKLQASVALISCPAGSEKVGEECLLCNNGKNSSSGISCDYCPDGYVGDSSNGTASTSCTTCLPGTYRNGTMPSCTACALGYEPTSDFTSCRICAPGAYRNASFLTCQSMCPEGAQPRQPIPDACEPCPTAYYKNATKALCGTCPAGSEPNTGKSSCVSCPSGAASQPGFLCSLCPNGTQPSNDKSSCQACPVGQFSTNGTCLDCPAGQTSPGNASSCSFCEPGEVVDSIDKTCHPCPVGTYSNASTLGSCLNCPIGQISLGGNCSDSVRCLDDGTCSLVCDLLSSVCAINTSIIVSQSSGGRDVNKTVSVSGNVVVAGNVTLTGSVTVSLTPGSRLDVEKCLTLSDGATVEVIISETTVNGTIVASFDSSCSSLPPVTITSGLDKCQYGEASTQTVQESGTRARLEVIFSPPAATCNNGTANIQGGLTSMQTIGIIVGCVVGGLVLILLAVAFGVPSVRQKIFPYSQREAAKGTNDVEMAPAGSDSPTPGPGQQSLPDIETHEEQPMQRSWKPSGSPRPL
eukprot:TRINITY_DN3512_c0_g1_i1.p1 TRINITY_DN3512_c0_g1~~TRINITY_DN3512_c0_g1_i1.p1  ORF type:complete len:955 (-),score=56.13 TRINITY_DN3512_c0_g1_i1:36-2645(-)